MPGDFQAVCTLPSQEQRHGLTTIEKLKEEKGERSLFPYRTRSLRTHSAVLGEFLFFKNRGQPWVCGRESLSANHGR